VPGTSDWKDLLENPGSTGHFVQLYQEGDEFYYEAISHFSAAGLKKDESVILVATAAHQIGISRKLAGLGFDVAELERKGQLTLLNANETLPRFVSSGMLDAVIFKDIARAAIEKARKGGRYHRVRWWGEMVNILYADGNLSGSTRVEELTDEVAHEEKIAILCSYCMDKFDPAIYDGPLQAICRTHAAILPAPDCDEHRQCVDRAVREVFGNDGLLKALTPDAAWTIPRMPAAQALLLWLKKSRPADAELVLSLARGYHRREKGTPR
jgi:hypothetical protein